MTPVHEHRKCRRGTASRPHSTRSQNELRDHDVHPLTHSEYLDKPANLEDLRKARITYLEIPELIQNEKMKYEYTRRVPVKKAVNVTEVSTGRRRRSRSVKHTTSKEEKPNISAKVDDLSAHDARSQDRYVYRAPCDPIVEQQETTSDEEDNVVDRDKTTSKSQSSAARRKTPRRHTAPASEPRSMTSKPDSISQVTSVSRSRQRTTATTESRRPVVKSRSYSERPESDTGSVVSTTRRRSSSVLGLFRPNPTPTSEPKVSCLTCGDDVARSRTAKLPCSHRMCNSCLKRIFRLAITDPAHMPPKCCTDQHIDEKHVDKLFDEAFKKVYNRKFKEYNAKNRIYCPKKGCGQWIQPKHMSNDRGRKVGKCPTCKTLVCALCNQKMHKSRDCPKDPAMKQFTEMAKESGWQKCYNCSATVELKEGCNHMTCRCTAEFCMVCGLKWKSCDCPWFNYDQLDATGDPVRYQQEMDRRREQEYRDAEMARRMEAFEIDDETRHMFGIGNATGPHLNQNFIQQAREALTANYQAADQAARGILNGFFTGRENPMIGPLAPPTPQAADQDTPEHRPAVRRRRTAIESTSVSTRTPAGVPVVRRHTNRRRESVQNTYDDPIQVDDAAEEQERRMRQWADDGSVAQ